jgi:hypothetical protein
MYQPVISAMLSVILRPTVGAWCAVVLGGGVGRVVDVGIGDVQEEGGRQVFTSAGIANVGAEIIRANGLDEFVNQTWDVGVAGSVLLQPGAQASGWSACSLPSDHRPG